MAEKKKSYKSKFFITLLSIKVILSTFLLLLQGSSVEWKTREHLTQEISILNCFSMPVINSQGPPPKKKRKQVSFVKLTIYTQNFNKHEKRGTIKRREYCDEKSAGMLGKKSTQL
ncbi:hypothetical protein NPIL_415011 [Nephila pilipes]|uniref:Uncharacterized protein n=1 Tax=Nephila pilipes TaxID=299642 RepID=A0A8X6P9S9_NEPPI|nr:hypothetical protein NPIL_415011 [Nephila pilipes]